MNEFVEKICVLLGITMPIISDDVSKFRTETTQAICDGTNLYVRNIDSPTLDTYFAVAHELRHIYQVRTNSKFYFDNYKDSSVLNVYEYNMQPAEIDANAFAMIIMEDAFGVTAKFDGLDRRIVDKIYSRADEIISDLAY